MGKEARDKDLAVATAMTWALAFCTANHAGPRQGRSRAGRAGDKHFFEVLDDRAAVHVVQGLGVDEVDALYVEGLSARPPSPCSSRRISRIRGHGALLRAAGRAPRAASGCRRRHVCRSACGRSTLSGSPDAADCRLLSQCLPLLPPAAGTPASAEWLALLKSQGPFVLRDGF